jgi:hypothetical protein
MPKSGHTRQENCLKLNFESLTNIIIMQGPLRVTDCIYKYCQFKKPEMIEGRECHGKGLDEYLYIY